MPHHPTAEHKDQSDRQIFRHFRTAYLAFKSNWRRIELVREMLPDDERSKSPVLSDLYVKADRAMVALIHSKPSLWRWK